MIPEILTVAGTKLVIIPAKENAEYIESVMLKTKFYGEQHFKIFDNGVRKNRDRYSYEDPKGSRYSHPTKAGARRMIAKSLLELGIIEVPEGNEHLCKKNRTRMETISKARSSIISDKPIVGDIIYIDGLAQRFSNCIKFGAQTSEGGSFHISLNGTSSFSGRLERAKLYECFVKSDEKALAKFWMWDAEKGSGGGNGVEIKILVNSWHLVQFEMTEDQAKAHPATLHFRKVFEDCSWLEREAQKKVLNIMKGFI